MKDSAQNDLAKYLAGQSCRWCLCLPRWIEAYNANAAPKLVLEATHVSVLEHIDLELLKRFTVVG